MWKLNNTFYQPKEKKKREMKLYFEINEKKNMAYQMGRMQQKQCREEIYIYESKYRKRRKISNQ